MVMATPDKSSAIEEYSKKRKLEAETQLASIGMSTSMPQEKPLVAEPVAKPIESGIQKIPDTTIKVFSSDQLKQYAPDFKENWMMKFTPSADGKTHMQTLISPDGKEYNPEDIYITETGDWVDKDQLKSLYESKQAEQQSKQDTPWLQNPFSENARAMFDQSPWYAKYTPLAAFTGLAMIAPKPMETIGNTLEKYVDRPFMGGLLNETARLGETFADVTKRPELHSHDIAFSKKTDELYAKYGWKYVFSDDLGKAIEDYRNSMTGAGKVAVTAAEWVSNPAYLIPVGEGFGVAAKLTSKIPVLGKAMEWTAAGVQATEKGFAYPVAKPVELLGKGAVAAGNKFTSAAASYLVNKSNNLMSWDMLESAISKGNFDKLIQDNLVDNWQRKALQRLSKVPVMNTAIKHELGYRILLDKTAQDVENAVGRGAVGHIEITNMGKNLSTAKFYELSAIEMNPKNTFGFNDQAFSKTMQDRLLPEFAGETAQSGTLEHVFASPEKYNWEGIGRKIKYTGNDGQVHEGWSGLVYAARVQEVNEAITGLLKKEGILVGDVTEEWIHRVVQESKGANKVSNKTKQTVGAEQSFLKGRKFKTMAEGIQWFMEHPEVGYQYSANIEKSVTEYIQQAFKTIADKRFAEYVEEFGTKPTARMIEKNPDLFTKFEVLEGKLPAKDLIEHNGSYYKPKQAIIGEQVAKAKQFQDLVNQAIGGRDKYSTQTLNAIQRMFPDLGYKFRNLVNHKPASMQEIQKYVTWLKGSMDTMKSNLESIKSNKANFNSEINKLNNELAAAKGKTGISPEEIAAIQSKHDKVIADLTKTHAEELKKLQKTIKAQAENVKATVEYTNLPDNVKLEEAFKVMPQEGRMALRDSLEIRMREAGEMADHNFQEMQMLSDTIESDTIANVDITTGYKKVKAGVDAEGKKLMANGEVKTTKLIDWIRWKYGNNSELPETFTKGEALAIKNVYAGREYPKDYKWPEHMLNKEGRVKTEYIFDEWQEKFNMDYDQLRDHINNLFSQKQQLDDLKSLSGMGQESYEEYKRIADILDKVDAEAEKIPIPAMESTYVQEYQNFDEPFPINSEDVANKIAKGESLTLEEEQFRANNPQAVEDILKAMAKEEPEVNMAPSTSVQTGLSGFGKDEAQVKMFEESNTATGQGGVKQTLVDVTQPENKPLAGQTELPENTNFTNMGYSNTTITTSFNTNMSLEEANQINAQVKKLGLPDFNVEVKPQIEGIPELSQPTTMRKPKEPMFPNPVDEAKRLAALKELLKEVNGETLALREQKLRAQNVYSEAKKNLVEIGEGYLPQPFANGKIFSRDFIDEFNKFFGVDKGLAGMRVISDVSGIARMLKASLDVSVMLAQGLPSYGLAHAYLVANPKIGAKLMGAWYKALAYNIGSFIAPELIMKYVSVNRDLMQQMVSLGGSVRTVDYFEALSSQTGVTKLVNKGLDKIPLRPYKRAETAFFAGGQVIRTEMFKSLYPMAVKAGSERELVRMLDRLTGIFDSTAAGVPLSVREIESTIGWFAPNYTRSCMTLCAEMFRGGMTGDVARKSLLGLAGAGATFFFSANYAKALLEGKNEDQAMEQAMAALGVHTDSISGETSWKPDRNFMSLKSGDTYYGIGGFWTGLMKLIGNINDVVTSDPKYGKGTFDLYTLLDENRQLNKDNPFVYWWFSRSAPFFSTSYEIWTNKDFMGYPISRDESGKATSWAWENPAQFAQYIGSRITPMWLSDMPALNPNAPDAQITPAGVAFSFLGGNVSMPTYYDKFTAMADKIITQQSKSFFNSQQIEAWQNGMLHFEQLTDMQKTELYKSYPELLEAYKNYDADRVSRNNEVSTQYKQRISVERNSYISRLNGYYDVLKAGNLTMKDYRTKISDAGSNYATIIDSLKNDPVFEKYIEYLNNLPDANKYGYDDARALSEYESQIANADDLFDVKTDSFNWKERDRRIDAFIQKWGMDVYTGILTFLNDKKYQQGIPAINIWRSQLTEELSRTYWRLPYKPYSDMDKTDLADGNIPKEVLPIWTEYFNLGTKEEKAAFIKSHPDFGKDYRQEYRMANPQTDANLAFWGYGGKVQTMDAYNQVVRLCKQYGVSVDALELGLPPQSVMPNYFEYNKLISQFKGVSPEAKVYRLEHPDWEAWGEENLGWTKILDNVNALKISVKWRDMDNQYDSFSDPKSVNYVENETGRENLRKAFLVKNLSYADDRRRRDAYNADIPNKYIEEYVQYYRNEEAADKKKWLLSPEHANYYKDVWLGILENQPVELPVSYTNAKKSAIKGATGK